MRNAIIFGGLALTTAANVPNHSVEPEYNLTVDSTISLPSVSHSAFKRGERLEFDISYGWIDAGEAIIEITEERKTINDRPVMHVVGTGNSRGTFNWFFKVRDRYETYLDEEGVFPWLFVRDIHEGGFELQQEYTFDPYAQTAVTNKGKSYEIPLGVQDMISAFYKARTLDLATAKPGQIFELEAFVDNEVWPLKIKYLRDESIEIERGTFDCQVFVPVVQKGRIFKEEEDMLVWVTKDKNHIPVLAKASILVGSIDMELRDFSGLANPIAMR